jgi:hypothetical protein
MWDVLGIAPTTDQTIIRRAYAAKLRSIGGDRDPVVFMRLREAYEAALAWRDSGADPIVTFAADDVAEAEAPFTAESSVEHSADDGVVDLAVPLQIQDRPVPVDDQDPTLADFDRAVAGKSTIGAWRCLDRLMARGVIGIGDEREPALRLAELALHDLDLPAESFAELVGHFGFVSEIHDDDTPRLRRLIGQRLAAEAWLAVLRNTAAKRAWGKVREEVRIARAFVGTRRIGRLPGIKSGRLQKTIDEFRGHRSWIDHRIDVARIVAVESRLQRVLRCRRRRGEIYLLLFRLFVVWMVFDAIWILVTVKQH